MESEEDDVEAEESGMSEEPDVMRKLESSLNELQVDNEKCHISIQSQHYSCAFSDLWGTFRKTLEKLGQTFERNRVDAGSRLAQ